MMERTDWKSIYAIDVVAIIATTQISAMMSVWWPYLQQLNPATTETFFGYIMAANSLGHAISAPIVGWWSNRISNVRIPMVFGKFIGVTGGLLYLSIQLVPNGSQYVLLVVQLMFGLAGGCFGLTRTVLAMASTEEDRTKAISTNTFCGGAGMMLGPGLQVLFTYLGSSGIPLLFGLRLNMYTAPMFMALILNIIAIFLLVFVFKDVYQDRTKVILVKQQEAENLKDSQALNIDESESVLAPAYKFPFDIVAVCICLSMRLFVGVFMVGLGTIEVPFTMRMFNWANKDAVFYNSIVSFVTGGLSLTTNMCFIVLPFLKKFNERIFCLAAQVCVALFFVVTYPYPFITSTIPIPQIIPNTTTPASANCEWCQDTPAVNLYVYMAMYTMVNGIAVPFSMVALDSLFSKVLGSIKQGLMQGIFICSGDIVNIGGPIFITALFVSTGIRYIWIIMFCLATVVFSLWVGTYRRLVPQRMRQDHKVR